MVTKKLLEIQKGIRSLATNKEGQTGAARYNYLSGSKLLDEIRPRMDNLGVLLVSEVESITNKEVEYNTAKGVKKEMFTSLQLKFTWIDTEDDTRLEAKFAANGMNAFDKGLGSALTYGERYFLLKFFHISTDEDDVDALIKDEAITPAVVEQKPKAKAEEVEPVPLDILVTAMLSAKSSAEAKQIYLKYKDSLSDTERQTLYDTMMSLPSVKEAMAKKTKQ